MGLRRKIEFEDRRAYEKWTSDFGFSPDIVLKVAKRFKKGEIRKLDAALSQYFKLNLLSEREIESFESSKQELLELTREINRIIGYYHPSLELVAEEYVTPWTQKGYDGETFQARAFGRRRDKSVHRTSIALRRKHKKASRQHGRAAHGYGCGQKELRAVD